MTSVEKIAGQNTTRSTEFRGLSTDTKPTDNVPNGSTYLEMDTSKVFGFDEEHKVWIEM